MDAICAGYTLKSKYGDKKSFFVFRPFFFPSPSSCSLPSCLPVGCDNSNFVYSLSFQGRAGVPMEVMGLMLGDYVDDATHSDCRLLMSQK